jgi:hypothetical protein
MNSVDPEIYAVHAYIGEIDDLQFLNFLCMILVGFVLLDL